MEELAPKKVTLSKVIEDLNSGLTKWKKDDVGFGSLEKKYNLLQHEMIELLSHPKIKNVESAIQKFVIVDDLPELEETTKIEVSEPIEGQQQAQKTQITKKPVEVRVVKHEETFI